MKILIARSVIYALIITGFAHGAGRIGEGLSHLLKQTLAECQGFRDIVHSINKSIVVVKEDKELLERCFANQKNFLTLFLTTLENEAKKEQKILGKIDDRPYAQLYYELLAGWGLLWKSGEYKGAVEKAYRKFYPILMENLWTAP